MDDTVKALIIILIIILVLAAIGLGIYFKVKSFTKRVARNMFGTDSLVQGIKQQQDIMSETPKSLSAMTPVYLPMINKDFPDFNYDEFKRKAEGLLLEYFNAVETLTPITNMSITNNVRLQVNGIINKLRSNNQREFYKNVVLHSTEISRYVKSPGICKIILQTSLEDFNYIVDGTGRIIFGSSTQKEQTIYETELVYVQDIKLAKDGGLTRESVLNCPNCGAPITNPSAKYCEFCGTGIVQKNLLVWSFNSIKEISGLVTH